jgi:acetyl esterase/lipase
MVTCREACQREKSAALLTAVRRAPLQGRPLRRAPAISVPEQHRAGASQAARGRRVEADLQIFEGFSHACYTIGPFIPESREAFEEIARFLSAHLAK